MADGAVMPDVTVMGQAHIERWAAVAGSDLPRRRRRPDAARELDGIQSPLLQNMLSATKTGRSADGRLWTNNKLPNGD